MTEESLKKYFEVYTDCWKLFRKYSSPNESDEYWDLLYREISQLYNQYNTDFAKKMLLLVYEEMEKISGKIEKNDKRSEKSGK